MYRRITQAINITGVQQIKGLVDCSGRSLPSMRHARMMSQLSKLSPATE